MENKDSLRVTIIMKRSLHKQLRQIALDNDTTLTALLTDCAEKVARDKTDRTTETKSTYNASTDRQDTKTE